ncbi:hypothetical protein WME89_39180 [Sorangium sp. So ce321]
MIMEGERERRAAERRAVAVQGSQAEPALGDVTAPPAARCPMGLS